MTQDQKKQIQEQLRGYINRFGSQNKAANSIGVSSSTISQILNDNWDNVADEMWRKISAQVGGKPQWEAVETKFFREFTTLLDDARRNSFVYAITAEAGSGKSFACKYYAASHRNVLHISCCEAWGVQAFLTEILKALGLERQVNNNSNLKMMTNIVSALKKADSPLIILDEGDKLSEKILYSLISLYNQLEEICGIVLCATDYLKTKIESGVETERQGYKELNSRIGGKFLDIPACKDTDIAAICNANGIDNTEIVAEIANTSDGDLRRVKRLIHAHKNR